MMRTLVLLLCFPIAAIAEPVAIRSGEHETFSRLVISIGEGTEWGLQQTETGFMLELTGRSDGFDVSKVFERIPRSRIIDVSQPSENMLSLDVACDCFADAFLWRPGQLVLDVVDGENPNAPLAIFVPLGVSAPSNAPQSLPNLLALQSDMPPPFAPFSPAMSAEAAVQQSDLQMTETALIEGLARAASQGFLDAAVTRPVDTPVAPAVPAEIVSEPQMSEPMVGFQQPGVGITTAMDRDFAVIQDVLASTLGQQCLPADLFEVNDWATDDAFHDQVAGLAEALAGEFGEQPLAAQDTLARLYIHFGFGAEARVVLKADAAQSRTRQVLIQLAGLIDDYDGHYELIEAQAGCDTPAALWAFFSEPMYLDDDSRNHVLQEFFALPQPLRGQIAPRLARKFVDVGDADGAEKLLRASENHDAAATHDVQSARALVAEEFDNPEQAMAVLTQQANDNPRTTPESLIRLLELGMENGVVPLDADLVLAAAMRQEHRDTPIELRLAVAEASGRTQLGNYQAAIDLMQARDDTQAFRIIDAAFAHMTENATSTVFLGFGFGDIPKGVTAQTENQMADRMINLGFPERAQAFLAGSGEREVAAERRYLRAQAAIGVRDFTAAIDALLGMTDSRARDLRATAYDGLGAHREALSALEQADEDGSDPTRQFRAGAWERLTIEEDEVLSTFAQTVLTPPTTNAVETLADRRAILAQSVESRKAVEGLLLRFDGVTAQE